MPTAPSCARGGVPLAAGPVGGEPVYRITALTNDPNHIGILLTMPIVIVLALATAAVRRTALLLATLAVGLTIALALSQSRSGLVGLVAGLLVLAATLRTRLVRGPLMWPAITAFALAAVAILTRLDSRGGVLDKRLNPDTPGSSIHTRIYGTIPDVLANHPLAG